jgi:hypothetical protein
MKKIFLSIVFASSFQMAFGQITAKSVIKPIVKPEKITQYASEIDVYISIQNGMYTTDEIYTMFRGENPKIKLMLYSFGAPSITPQVAAINGIFPSYVNDFQTILYKVKIANSDKPTYIVACIDEQELNSKDAQIVIDFEDESCSGILPKSNIFNIENNFSGVYKKFDNTEKGCRYIRLIDIDKTLKFRITKIHHEK